MEYKLKRTVLGQILLKYSCEKCGENLESPISDAGKKDRCPACEQGFVVPGLQERLKLESRHKQATVKSNREGVPHQQFNDAGDTRNRENATQVRASALEPVDDDTAVPFKKTRVRARVFLFTGAGLLTVLAIALNIPRIAGKSSKIEKPLIQDEIANIVADRDVAEPVAEELSAELPPMDLTPKEPDWPALSDEPENPDDPSDMPKTAKFMTELHQFDVFEVRREGDLIEIKFNFKDREPTKFGFYSHDDRRQRVIKEDIARMLEYWAVFLPVAAKKEVVSIECYGFEPDKYGNPATRLKFFDGKWHAGEVQRVNYDTLSVDGIMALSPTAHFNYRLRSESKADSYK